MNIMYPNNDLIDKILNEWSFRCYDGIVDINDPKKIIILNEILLEEGIYLNKNTSPKISLEKENIEEDIVEIEEEINTTSESNIELKEKLTKNLTSSILELFDTKHFQLRLSERGNILNILNLNKIPLKDYNPSDVKEELKINIENKLKDRAKEVLGKDIPLSNTYDIGIKMLKPVLVVDKEKYPLLLFAISTKEVKNKDGSIEIKEIENEGTLYFATVSDNKATTLLLLKKEDDNELYFQIKKHRKNKSGGEKEAKILTLSDYIYEIDLDELMGKEKKEQTPTLIDPSSLPYEVRTDYRKNAIFNHKDFGAGTIVDTSSGAGGKGDSRGKLDWIDVKYAKPFLKAGKFTDIRRFKDILTLVSPMLSK